MRICVYGASSSVLDEKYIMGGYELGRAMAEKGHSLVFGGGDTGLMGAVARGVKEHGGEVIGVAPSFFNVEASPVLSITDECISAPRSFGSCASAS